MRKLIITLTILLVHGLAQAQDNVKFTVDAPQTVVLGDVFRIAYVVTTNNSKDFRGPGKFTGFDVLMGPSMSQRSSVNIVNGNVTQASTVVYTYTLKAIQEGKSSIPAATITANGKTMISNSVNITVLPKDQTGAQGSSGSNQTRRGSGRDRNTQSTDNISDDDIFFRAVVSRTKIYEQEAFLLTYKLYIKEALLRDNTIQRGNDKMPDFKGFVSQEFNTGTMNLQQLEHYNGHNYGVGTYKQFVLFPQQVGKLIIEPAKLDIVVSRMARNVDPIDMFFNGTSATIDIKKTLATPSITINVEPLPANKPSSFGGGVGMFTLKSDIKADHLKINEAVTITLTIAGTGNLRLLGNPQVHFPAEFEKYDPKVNNQITLTKNGNTGEKVIEYLAIARREGTYTIPPVEFTYFDPQSKNYKTLRTEPYTIVVEKGEDGQGASAINTYTPTTNQEELKILGQDIRFIKRGHAHTQSRDKFFFGSWAYLCWYFIPFVLFVAFIVFYRKQAVENANIAKMRTKKANKTATKRLKLAGKLLMENRKDEFYDEVLKTLWGYISDKLNIPVSQLSKDNVAEKLTNREVDNELVLSFLNALNECEYARFAPGDEHQAMDKVYTAALDVISKIENSMKH